MFLKFDPGIDDIERNWSCFIILYVVLKGRNFLHRYVNINKRCLFEITTHYNSKRESLNMGKKRPNSDILYLIEQTPSDNGPWLFGVDGILLHAEQ